MSRSSRRASSSGGPQVGPRAARRATGKTRPMRWLLVLLPVLLLGVAIALVRAPSGSTGSVATGGSGSVVPDHTLHQFGTVRMGDGLLTAAFPLAVDGAVDAVDLGTS